MNDLAQRYVTASIGVLRRGHWQEGLLLADRGLSERPLQPRSLFEFVAQATGLAARDDENQADYLAMLEGFVRGRVLFAELDDIDAVITCAESLSSRRTELLRSRDIEEPPRQAEAELAELLTAAREGTLDEVVATSEDYTSLREALHAARELTDGDPETQEVLTSAIESAELAAAFDEAAKESGALLERVAKWKSTGTNLARAGMALQQVEGTLRPLAAFSHRLDRRRVATVDALLDQLRQAATRIAKQTRESDASEQWKAFEREYERAIRDALESAEPSVDDPDRHCQERLERIQRIQEKLLPLLATIQETEAWTKARDCAEALARRSGEIAQQQQRRYDSWALAQIRRCYAEASRHIKTISDDEEQIAQAMIGALGGLDVRCLGHEVQRSFNEVFELLYQYLERPKKEADFDAKDGKLYVLAQMFLSPKKTTKDF